MPVIYKKLQYNSQFGINTEDENYVIGGTVAGILTNRVSLMRFSHLEIPKNSTINSATLHLTYSHKNDGAVISFSQQVYMDGQTPTQWLDASRREWNSEGVPHRTWSLPSGSASVNVAFTQNTTTPRNIVSHNVKPHLDALVVNPGWTLGGGSATFLVAYGPVSNPDYTYLHGPSDGWSPTLEVNFTPPASDGKATVVNIQENSIFTRSTNAAGGADIAPYGFNDWFGTYAAPTSVSVTGSLGAEVTQAPPSGGNMLRLQGSTDGRFMYHFGVPRCEEGKWYNYSCWTWMPLNTPANFRAQITLLGDTVGSGMQYDKGVWVRHSRAFMIDDGGPWACVEVGGETWDSTCVLYVAGVQLTEGKMLRPWIGGNKTLSGADYGWAGIVGSNGFVRAVPPTAPVITPITDKAMKKYYSVNWSYAQGNGHVQDSAMVKVRKVR